MTTSTLTLTSFLLARITEDEAAALAVPSGDEYRVESSDPDAKPWRVADHYRRHQPARVLAECEAKRRIVEDLALPYIAERRRLMNGQPSWSDEHPDLLRWLALPYADHPDYRDEWRP